MDDAAETPAILTVFRSRLRQEATSLGYHELADELERRARAMPGFVEFKTFTGEDWERVSIVIFDSVDHHNAWRDDPEHVSAQQRGIAEFYAEYQITVAQVIRQHTHTGPESGTWPSLADHRLDIHPRPLERLSGAFTDSDEADRLARRAE